MLKFAQSIKWHNYTADKNIDENFSKWYEEIIELADNALSKQIFTHLTK